MPPRDARAAEVRDDRVDESDRPAEVDVPLGEIGDELGEVRGREEAAALGSRVVADEELDPDSPFGGDAVESRQSMTAGHERELR